jgi:cytochrome P450
MTAKAILHASRELAVPPTIAPPARQLGPIGLAVALLRNPLRTLSQELYEEPVVVYSRLGAKTAFVMAPELVRDIFHDQTGTYVKNPLDRRIMGRALGNGLLIAPDEDWRWQRRVVAPLFTPAALADTVPTIAATAERLLERWRAAPGGQVVDIGGAMVDLTFDIIHETLIADTPELDAALLKRAIADYLSTITWEIVYDFVGLPSWVWHPGTRRMGRSARIARGEIARLVGARRRSGNARDDLMGRLIAARDPETGLPASDEQVVDNLLTFLIAGHETTARALAWSLYLTAYLPDWHDRLSREIGDVAGGSAASIGAVERLALTKRFIEEAMRLFPSAPIISRVTAKPASLGGVALGRGARILVPIYVIHRHRALWSEPDRFDPDRFRAEAQAGRPRYAYMPFGAGPRMCIGASFAMIEAMAIMATLLRGVRFEIVDDEPPEPVSGITLTPGKPLLLKVVPC